MIQPAEGVLALRVADVSLAYDGHPVLEGVSFELPRGAMLGIVGPNGCGKSTLLKILLGLRRPQRGSVEVLGHPPRQLPARSLGYVPQLKTLDRRFPALAIELVATGLLRRWPLWISRSTESAAIEALERVGAAHLAKAPVSTLSGGELQRVYLARAMIRQPELLVLDEPMTGIDLRGEQDFYAILDRYHRERGATVLIVTHDLSAARHHTTHVLLLRQQVIAFGPPEQALASAAMDIAFSHAGHDHSHPVGATS